MNQVSKVMKARSWVSVLSGDGNDLEVPVMKGAALRLGEGSCLFAKLFGQSRFDLEKQLLSRTKPEDSCHIPDDDDEPNTTFTG